MKLVFEFSEDEFVAKCAEYALRTDTTLFEDIYEALCFYLNSPKDLEARLTKVNHKYSTEYQDPSLSLVEYTELGYIEFYYPVIEYYSSKDDPLDISDIELPHFISIGDIKYGCNVTRAIKVKQHGLKTVSKVSIQLYHVKILQPTLSRLNGTKLLAKATLIPSKLGVYEWRQTFYNKITGEPRFCSCFTNAIKKGKDSQFINTHSHVLKAIKENHFQDDICHLCTGVNSDLFFCHSMYGSAFKVKYGGYIRKFEVDEGLDERQAENYVRDIKGIPRIGEKWISETLLFKYVDALFADYEVIREASPRWLDRQRLDIYIPELTLAIEYQGQQHYKAVDFFGGEEALEKNRMRDALKASKCKQNKIDLIYFSYKDELSEKLVGKRLEKYL